MKRTQNTIITRDFYRQSLVNGCSTTFNDESLDSHTYAYDAANRLASVSSNDVVLLSNQYDHRNRRIRKTTPTKETTVVYDGRNLVHNVVAVYEHDDFGHIISQSGLMADIFRIRFSSKYYDTETGLYYSGRRPA